MLKYIKEHKGESAMQILQAVLFAIAGTIQVALFDKLLGAVFLMLAVASLLTLKSQQVQAETVEIQKRIERRRTKLEVMARFTQAARFFEEKGDLESAHVLNSTIAVIWGDETLKEYIEKGED